MRTRRYTLNQNSDKDIQMPQLLVLCAKVFSVMGRKTKWPSVMEYNADSKTKESTISFFLF